jgi:hypothetical protein
MSHLIVERYFEVYRYEERDGRFILEITPSGALLTVGKNVYQVGDGYGDSENGFCPVWRYPEGQSKLREKLTVEKKI